MTKRKAGGKAGGQPPRGTQFQPGVSGNPAGMKRGTKHRRTILSALLREGDIETLVASLVRKGKGKDTATARWLVDRWIELQAAAIARDEKRKENAEREARLLKQMEELRALIPGYLTNER